jgi:hypothetical protein
MKRIIASAGLAALGAASTQAAYTPGLTPYETSKPWSIGLDVRGFYDDNYLLQPSDSAQETWGVSVMPWFDLNLALDQTLIGLNYTYQMWWYEDSNKVDQAHNAEASVQHAFSDRYKLNVWDRFTYSDRPSIDLEAGPITDPLRNEGSYYRNIGNAGFTADVTRTLVLDVGYKNVIWDYSQAGPGSRSALSDRMEHLATGEVGFRATPELTALLGFHYGEVDYNNDETINPGSATPLPSDSRDRKSWYIYAGITYQMSTQWDAAVRIGAQWTDFSNIDHWNSVYAGSAAWEEQDNSTVTPYVDAFMRYTYNPGSYIRLGVINTINSTDVLALGAESVAGYAEWTHRITPRWTVGLLGLIQNSWWIGGGDGVDSNGEILYVAGASLEYSFNKHLLAEVGYGFDNLRSDVETRDYQRNRVYFGLRGVY